MTKDEKFRAFNNPYVRNRLIGDANTVVQSGIINGDVTVNNNFYNHPEFEISFDLMTALRQLQVRSDGPTQTLLQSAAYAPEDKAALLLHNLTASGSSRVGEMALLLVTLRSAYQVKLIARYLRHWQMERTLRQIFYITAHRSVHDSVALFLELHGDQGDNGTDVGLLAQAMSVCTPQKIALMLTILLRRSGQTSTSNGSVTWLLIAAIARSRRPGTELTDIVESLLDLRQRMIVYSLLSYCATQPAVDEFIVALTARGYKREARRLKSLS